MVVIFRHLSSYDHRIFVWFCFITKITGMVGINIWLFSITKNYMKIFNYSDKPVVINGVPIHEHLIHIDNSIQRHFVTHNGREFLSSHLTDDRNLIFSIINHPNGSYNYREQNFAVPNIWLWIGVFLTFFSFMFLTRVIQKLKTS